MERLLRNGGAPLEKIPEDPGVTVAHIPASVLDPRYEGWTVHVRFVRDQPRKVNVESPTRDPYRGPSLNWRWMQEMREWVLVFACVGLCLAVVVLPFAFRWRRGIAEFALGAALVAAVAWSLYPFRVWDGAHLLEPMPLGIAGASLLFVICLLLPRPQRKSGHPKCLGCGYDLTGNQSGVCPECGRPRMRVIANRWENVAHQIEAVEVPPPEDADEEWEVGAEPSATDFADNAPAAPE